MIPVKGHIKEYAIRLGLLELMRGIVDKKAYNQLNSRYEKYRETGNLPLPEDFIFDLTFKCNLHCKMCYIHFPSMWKKRTLDDKLEMNIEQIKEAFDNIPKISNITLIGGEIFTRTDIFDILDYFEKRGANIWLSTNLTLIDNDKIERLKRYKCIGGIGTSIDGDRDKHNDIRDPHKREAFDKTINTIKKLKDHFYISILAVMLDENLNNLSSILKVAKESGAHLVSYEFERRYTEVNIEKTANYLGFNYEHFPLAISDSSIPIKNFEDYKKATDDIKRHSRRTGIDIVYLPVLFRKELKKYLTRRIDTVHFCKQLFIGRIDAQGNVIHCFAIRKSFGNLLSDKFENIWNSNDFIELRRKMDRSVLPICETCEKLVERKRRQNIELI